MNIADGSNSSSLNCGKNGTIWINEFNIPESSEVTQFGGKSRYWVKPLYTVQLLSSDTSGGCRNETYISNVLESASALSLPESTGYSANGITYQYTIPNNGSSPTFEWPPAVINGINQ